MTDKEGRRPARVSTDKNPLLPEEETDWNAVYLAQQAEPAQPTGGLLDNQAAKIGCGCLLPAIVMMSSCAGQATSSPSSPDMLPAYVAGGLIAGMLMGWAPLFVFWLRDQSKWIIGGSFVAFALVLGISQLAKVGREQQKIVDDLSVIGSLEFDKDGNAIFPEGTAAKGPMGKVIIQLAADRDKIHADFIAARTNLGIDALFDAKALAKNSKILSNCANIQMLEAEVVKAQNRSKSLITDMGEKIDNMPYSPSIKSDMRRGLEATKAENLAVLDQQWDIQQRSIAPTYRACVILAKRRWQSDGPNFVFSNAADLGVFNDSLNALNQLDNESAALLKNQTDKIKSGRDNVTKIIDKMKGN
jgi:hypothetical protein